ncbi:Olfactory receptor 6Y1 [Chelonia mydas]|uniref:Olfactory receptor 6Y1 n=1 Tax=Chelonia mydas TaxID=8469 RepID=M7AV52_CHEMY|nr:Olfactory receptor 6Y1 [Chelonia mydas]
MDEGNQTNVSHFILLGFPTSAELYLLLFSVFLLAYLLTLMENIIIILVIQANHQLHKPMNFFLGNLSFLEIWYVTVIVPKMLADFMTQDKRISFQECMAQLYFFVTFVCTEYILLAAMAYDRYLAICNPLRYPSIMSNRFCTQLAASCWLCGLITAAIKLSFIAQLRFCSIDTINHYFYDISPLLNISCTDSSLAELVNFILALMVIMVPLCIVVTSYICSLCSGSPCLRAGKRPSLPAAPTWQWWSSSTPPPSSPMPNPRPLEGDSINCANAMYGSGSGNFIESVKVNGKSWLGQIMASNITLVKADLVKEDDYLPNQSVNVVVLYEFTEQIELDSQVKALIEEGKGRFLMGDGLLASTACDSEHGKGNCDLLEVAQCSEESSSLSVGSGNVPGKESLDEPRQPCELKALSSQQFGKVRIVEDECPYTLPVTCVENCDSEGNVPVSVKGIDLPVEGATPVYKQLSVNSPVCWDKGNEIQSCVSGKVEYVSASSLSVEQTEGAFQPVMVEDSAVVSELVLDSTKAQEGNGPKFVSARENGTVTRLHPVSVMAKSQRPNNSGACILPVANVWLGKGVATLSNQGDTLARAQGEQKSDLLVLPTDGVETCSKKEKIPELVCGKGKENASNLLSRKSRSLPERGLCRNPPDGPEVILDVSETQKESVVAQGSVPLEQALGEEGKGRISVRGELLLRKAPRERNPQGSLCKQFTATEGCESDLIKKVSVPNRQKFSVVNGSTDFPFERSSVVSFEKVSDGVKAVKKVEQPFNQVAVFGQLVGETRLLREECLQADFVSEQTVSQVLREDWVAESAEQNSCAVNLSRLQGMAGILSSLDTVDMTCILSVNFTSDFMWKRRLVREGQQNFESSLLVNMDGISLRQSPALELVAVKDLNTGEQAPVCLNANYLTDWDKKDLLIALRRESTPNQPVNSVKQGKSGFDPSGQGGNRDVNFAMEATG